VLKLKAQVSITGRDLEERGGDGFVIVTRGKRFCDGMPRCRTLLGADDCPYKIHRDTGA